MNRTTWMALVSFAAVAAIGMATAAEDKKPALEGQTFKVELIPSGAKTGDADTLSFAGGMFDSSACHQYGFGRSAYTAKPEGGKVGFEVHATGKAGDKQLWKGTVEGKQIHGTMTMTDAAGAVSTYNFKGSRSES